MRALVVECSEPERDRLVADLWERGTAGIVERELAGGRVELQAFFRDPFDAAAFPASRWEEVEDVNWARITMESWPPILVGERFFVVPDWRDDLTPEGRLRLETHPGLALGTGYHPTTQMCLEMMERWLGVGGRFLDLGTGAGILSQAAALLGAGRIVACDTDPQATESAAENFARASVPALLFTGSLDAVARGAADFLAANISAPAIVELTSEIARVLAPGGAAALSGFEPHATAAVREALARGPFSLLEEQERDGWAAIAVRRE
ncbi:MAG: 50S ribosomal protein L11 methyltransferase [Bryobacteraceae bacterium]|nr:50S ribosomal protein L11 methyltransferase [Bryobacteraceae bacterium]